MTEQVKKTMEALKANNMEPFFVKTKEEAKNQAIALLNKGETLSCGGSVTLAQTGIFDALKSGDYNFLDRSLEGLTAEDINKIYRDTFFADTYLTSANALTEKGELINVDGNANRVSAITFGPKQVVVVVGINKIVKNVEEGIKRVKQIAAPLNTKRLGKNTPCSKTGVCIAVNGGIADGCNSPDRICCDYVISAYQRQQNRIKVIICEENLGY